jgi:hypothetical protein
VASDSVDADSVDTVTQQWDDYYVEYDAYLATIDGDKICDRASAEDDRYPVGYAETEPDSDVVAMTCDAEVVVTWVFGTLLHSSKAFRFSVGIILGLDVLKLSEGTVGLN